MFYQNRFTERARQALTLAQEAAASFGHSYIGSEHLLLGLLREGGGPAAKALTAAGVTDEALVHQIEELSGRGTPDSTAPQGMTTHQRIVNCPAGPPVADERCSPIIVSPNICCSASCAKGRMWH